MRAASGLAVYLVQGVFTSLVLYSASQGVSPATALASHRAETFSSSKSLLVSHSPDWVTGHQGLARLAECALRLNPQLQGTR